ncbi:gamma-glutamyl:cysteine ligase YbdK (ATP-grasp superfamily) [Friedmanniella endophytica]|uniref:Gamma-glutamyl:cysteine ligase YbdK (ATP-grasp superfamily) n=1 Tax=Microlunatus kandeliicorticis TaxID=1759536 RepID=A0A7W3P6W1_9ACTN|nr:glutamate--cysteine ligase [Microlunatus kandeliicorticis]MBA8795389.1 gamma-glutamyl:cysteine ligase YbdK (ATP-grasp superfamily) [Microlunatus kandeliicorticis]
MGEEVDARQFTRADRKLHREKVRRGLDVLARMLTESRFDFERPMAGLEIELNLVDTDGNPAMRNVEVLDAIADPQFQTELGRFNIEINVAPRQLSEAGFSSFETSVRAALNAASERAEEIGARLVTIGILPTLHPEHVSVDNVSENPRYSLLDQQIFAARGEDLEIVIDGHERLHMVSDTIMPEAACTSTQVHLQVSPDDFAPYWNAAQAIAGVQLAVGANSPFLFGRHLVAESRIPLFEQATDTRSDELKAQGVRPRVWFGERWVTSIFDLFEENSTYFPALLPISTDEDPEAVLEAGGTPRLDELRLHNGTVYRWNRPVYDISDASPHLRVENRVLPAGPTVVDTMANAAFFAGLVRALAAEDRPIWSRMSFSAAAENFAAGVRSGIDAEVYWPDVGQVRATELVVRRLLPKAAEGLRQWGVEQSEIDRLLGIVEQRCLRSANGATWQVAEVERRERAGAGRREALRGMLSRYLELMHTNEPVHTWEAIS